MSKALIAALVAILCCVLIPCRQNVPAHMVGHPTIVLPDLFSKDDVQSLLRLTREIGRIPTAAREYDSYTVLRDNIGEAVPFNKSVGTCPETFLMPNGDLSKCVFPGRVDVARHFVSHGGPEAVKEKFQTLVSRMQAFQALLFDINKYPIAKKLLESPKFQGMAKGVCPKDKQILDPVQLNFVVQVPGQTVATHIDAPYFQRASRFHYPQWLLAAMVFSGLFQEEFIHQVQAVGYYHAWSDPTNERNGNFVIWDSAHGEPIVKQPASGSGNSVDGSKVVHAARIYRPAVIPPVLPKNAVNELVFRTNTTWDVFSDGKKVATYDEDDIMFTAVYRARCFGSQEEIEAYRQAQDDPIPLEEILDRFRQDLKKRGLWHETMKLTPYQFGTLILDTYIRYPVSDDAWFTFNWCAIDRRLPFLSPVVEALCN